MFILNFTQVEDGQTGKLKFSLQGFVQGCILRTSPAFERLQLLSSLSSSDYGSHQPGDLRGTNNHTAEGRDEVGRLLWNPTPC